MSTRNQRKLEHSIRFQHRLFVNWFEHSRSLRKLALLKNRLSNLNANMSEQYATSSVEYQRATRLASQIKGDLNDISLRLSYVYIFFCFAMHSSWFPNTFLNILQERRNIKKKLNILNSPLPPPPTQHATTTPLPPTS